MKLDKTNCCVFIENEAQLQQAREMLERYGEDVFHVVFWGKTEPLMYDPSDGNWFMCDLNIFEMHEVKFMNLITLSELEEILKGEKDESK